MVKLNKKERRKVYELALDLQKADRWESTKFNHPQSGLCRILAESLYRLNSLGWLDCLSIVKNLPEFIELKPNHKKGDEYWWSIKPNSRIREGKLREMIEKVL